MKRVTVILVALAAGVIYADSTDPDLALGYLPDLAPMEFVGVLFIAFLGAVMFRFRKPRRLGTRKPPPAAQERLTEAERPTLSTPRTEERLLQATPPQALPRPVSRKSTTRRPPISLWSGYRPPKRASKKRGRMGDRGYLQLGENHEP